MAPAFLIAARRTAVAPRGGAFARIEVHDLAAPVIAACLAEAGLPALQLDQVILGNALSGGGNVARLAALAAGLPDAVPALTLDTQCCAGLDAILLAARLVEAGAARAVLAGGVESFSRAPLRARRPLEPGEAPAFYDRPAFAPTPARDPDPLAAMAALAAREGITRAEQHALACASHARALAARERMRAEIVPLAGLDHDAFTRALTMRVALRSPLVVGVGEHALDAAGIAVEADAAALVLVVDEATRRALDRPACLIRGGASAGGPPEEPFAALLPAVARMMEDAALPSLSDLTVLEIMESSAVQFAVNLRQLGFRHDEVNLGGGALARGHPIGASGAILAVRLFHELHREPAGALGLAAIAAAGGLGSALMLQRS